jgi:hypothetical protein
VIKVSELRHLPVLTLEKLAFAAAADVDAGADKRDLLEIIMRAVARWGNPQ